MYISDGSNSDFRDTASHRMTKPHNAAGPNNNHTPITTIGFVGELNAERYAAPSAKTLSKGPIDANEVIGDLQDLQN